MSITLRFARLLLVAGLLGVSPAVTSAQDATYCGPDESPDFTFGFADLKAFVGDPMGDPVTCAYADPNGSGDVDQQTTTGSAVWRASTTMSIFSTDTDHWAISAYGSASWAGPGADPPPDLLASLLAPPPDDSAPAAPDESTPEPAPPPAPTPPPEVTIATGASIYWGAYIGGVPQRMAGLDALEAGVAKKVSIIHWGESWGLPPSLPFQTSYFQAVRDRGAIPLLDWGSWQLGPGLNQPDYRLGTIADGTYDSFLAQWASAARDWGHPLFLRFDPEMNGWWLPWSEQTNGNGPGDFVRAWRHVVDVFRAQGATNVTWVWCPNVASARSTPMSELYPGDDYVDWTCLDGYNFGNTSGYHWQTFAQVFGGPAFGDASAHNSYQELVSLAPSKPIMIGEVASAERGGSKGPWVTDMFQTLPTAFPQVKAVVWMDWNIGDPTITWPVASSRDAQASFANAIASPIYATNQFGNLPNGPIEPLAGGAQPLPNPMVLSPVADTYTSRGSPTLTQAGTSTTLSADLNGTDTAFLMFDLQPLAGKNITSATLRIHTSNQTWAGSTATFDVRLVPATNWHEEYMTYRNTVPVSNTVVGTLSDPKQPNAWYDISLTPNQVQAHDGSRLAVALSSRTSDVLLINAREAGGSVAPQLVVSYNG